MGGGRAARREVATARRSGRGSGCTAAVRVATMAGDVTHTHTANPLEAP